MEGDRNKYLLVKIKILYSYTTIKDFSIFVLSKNKYLPLTTMFYIIRTKERRIRERIAFWEDESFMWTFMLGVEQSFEEQKIIAWNIVCTDRLIRRLYKKLNHKR